MDSYPERPLLPRSGVPNSISGAAVPEIAVTMTGIQGITFALAAVLAVCAIAFRASLSHRAAMVLLTLAALRFLLALLHWGRWLPG
jgi:hypothetical protein